ncbi:hypothetical protein TRICI_000147 [Trichomonascus ciferrii]|uniref:Uncharacterized protein n=1 Tax=Trichomonascus ciferrii TaxID=44093 RepID=A0A642VE96_9ASCO|nr:hypothetical protein TRICI_000147 [Trichomonascus ciferrii]
MAGHPILTQIPLIVSPSLRPPQAVTLPFNFNKLPSTAPPQNVKEESLDEIIESSEGFLRALDQRRERREKAFADWKEHVDKEEIEEKRRIAPGYLDTNNRILQPLKRQETGESDSQSPDATQQPSSSELNQLDKVFGEVSLD